MSYSIKLRVGYSAGVQESYILAKGIPDNEIEQHLEQLQEVLEPSLLNRIPSQDNDNPFDGIIEPVRGDILRLDLNVPREIVYINVRNVTSIHLCAIMDA